MHLLSRRDSIRAADALQISVGLEPDRPSSRFLLALARLGQRRVDEARALLKQVPPADPYLQGCAGAAEAARAAAAVTLKGAGVAVLLTMALACGRSQPQTPLTAGQAQGANVLLVTIDTLRRDRVGAFGDRRGLTPTLDRLAAGGIRYTHAFSHVPMTLPAHTSILTGLTPRHHGVRNNTTFRLDERVPTLATALKGAGYRTGAFVGAFVLDGRFGLSRGFDEYNDRLGHPDRPTFHIAERRASEVVAAAGSWILAEGADTRSTSASTRRPWFAWVHLFDPHAPYDAPAGARADLAPYDAEVAYTDAMLGQFLDRLRAAGALDRTLVVVTADHGESLGEHGETTHGLFAYNATLAVPLIVNGPGLAPGEVDEPVAHADLMPTILDLLGSPIPGSLDGRSLVRAPARDRSIYFEALDASLTRGWAPLVGVIQNGWKFIDLPDAEALRPHGRPWRVAQSRQQRSARRSAEGLVAACSRVRTIGACGTAGLGCGSTFAVSRLHGWIGGATQGNNRGRRSETAGCPERTVYRRIDCVRSRPIRGGPVGVPFHPSDAAGFHQRPDKRCHDSADAWTGLGGPASAARSATRPGRFWRAAGETRRCIARDGRSQGRGGRVRTRPAGRQPESRVAERSRRHLCRPGTDRGCTPTVQGAAGARPGERDDVVQPRVVRTAEPPAGRRGGGISASGRDRAVGTATPGYALGSALVGTDRRSAADAWRHAEPLLPHNYDLLFNLGMLLADGDAPADAIPYLQRFVREAPRPRYADDIVRVRSALARLGHTPS